MITVSASPRIWSTGFKLEFWQASKINIVQSIAAMQLLFAKLITLNVPTMALISGHCYAGGVMLAMAHDFRIMREGSGVLCLSELNLGKTLPPAFDKICKSTMPM
jgi:enoyl-CoA hydratase/carnithine racemase